MDSIITDLHRGLSENCFADAELLAAQKGTITFHHAVGDHATQPNAVFDLASLTKPLCTATLCMILTDQKKFSVDDTVEKFFPTKNLHGVTLKELLNHTSGLAAWDALYKDCVDQPMDRQKNLVHMADIILNNPALIKNPRGTTEYSCLGYLLLTAIVERIGGAPLNELFDHLTDQSDLADQLFFVPHNQRPATSDQQLFFIPSSPCPVRNRVCCGEVMDLNAYALGGVSGNAGLFGSATAIHNALCELRRAKFGQSDLISQETFNLFCRPRTNDQGPMTNSYTPGFNTPTPGSSQSGTLFSQNTIGCLGYTGCSFWWDLEKDFWVILLTNRHMAEPENERFKVFRPELYDKILFNL